ncbi:MAG: Gfo/Idh/MocA family oxidoreductase [Candidatus Omnitrophica bacterium]|nr:Gfo/Idh/MocA family oxidoreductase [Candidatus Omnitrophota bacterium]
MEKLKVGIIGAGGISQVAHIPNFQKIEETEVACICDINKEKLDAIADKFKIPGKFTRWEDVIKEQLDIVVIASPNVFHKEQAVQSMENGKHVLCEKPLALTGKEADEIIKTAKKTGKKFMGAFPQRFTSHAYVIKKMVEKGEFGNIYYAKASYLRRRGIPGLGGWFTTKKLSGGGPLLDVGVHILDLVVYLMGCPEPETVMGTTFNKFKDSATDGGWPPSESRIGDRMGKTFDVEDLASGFVQFKNGGSLFIEASWAGNSETGLKISLFGTKSGAQYSSSDTPPLKIFSEMDGVLTDISPVLANVDSYLEEAKHFVECIRKDKEPITSPKEIITVAKIIEALYKSAETKKPVHLAS